jgi:hypothetical protein
MIKLSQCPIERLFSGLSGVAARVFATLQGPEGAVQDQLTKGV